MAGSETWRKRAEAELKGRDPDSLIWHTPEGIAVDPVCQTAQPFSTARNSAIATEAKAALRVSRARSSCARFTGRAACWSSPHPHSGPRG